MVLAFIWASTVNADGKALHDKACVQCHDALTGGKANTIYNKASTKVTTLPALAKRVEHCALAAGVAWSTTQKQQVVDYLAEQFYRF